MEKFIDAYRWMYGGTKKNAREIYRKADPDYIALIIKAYEQQNRMAFYDD